MYKKHLLIPVLLCLLMGEAHASFFQNGINTTPLTYQVGIRRIEFRKEDDQTWHTYGEASADVTMDIASVEAGAAVGTFPQTATLPVGTYDSMRFLINPTMVAKGAVYDSDRDATVWFEEGQEVEFEDEYLGITLTLMTANFESGNTLTSRLNTIEAVALSMPHEEEAVDLMGMNTETIDGVVYFYGDMPLQNDTQDARFEVDGTGMMPTIQMNFDVTDRLEFVYDEFFEDYLVTLQGPDVTIIVDGVTVVSRNDEDQQQDDQQQQQQDVPVEAEII